MVLPIRGSAPTRKEDPMRRAVQALVIGGVLLPAAACGIATGPTTAAPVGAPAATSAAAPAADGSIRSSCEALGQVYGKNLAPFAEALTDLVAARQKASSDKEPRAEVRRSLTEFASAIRAATSASTDPPNSGPTASGPPSRFRPRPTTPASSARSRPVRT
nr:hypothetical protein GCM10020092_040840 [Actinoplanes digitatis]